MSAPRILLVEDNTITRRMFRVALASQGWEVLEAGDGAAALAALEGGLPDLMVLDLTLPDTDGVALLRRVLERPGTAALPVIATSGFLSKLEQARTLGVGFAEHLYKPVDPLRLIEVVRAHLSAGTGPRPGQGRRVLVIDDDTMQARLIRLQLEQAGYAVRTAGSGAEGLDLARAAPPAAIVCDVLMPGMDGFRFCVAARREPALSSVPIVLASVAFTEEADRALARSVGASDLVLRGPEPTELLAALEDVLTRPPEERAHGPLPAQGGHLPGDEYTHRIVRQLERQVGHNADLAGRLALHEAAMGVMARLGETAHSPRSLEQLLPDLLQYALDAAGISIGAVFLRDAQGQFVVRAQLGFAQGLDLEGLLRPSGALERASAGPDAIGIPAGEEEEPAEERLLAALGARALMLVPLHLGDERLGVLVLASAGRRLSAEWLPFAQAIGVQIAHTVALARAVRELSSAQERWRELADAMPQIVWTAGPDGRVDTCNARWREYTGLEPEGDMWAQVVDPLDLALTRERWQASVAAQAPFQIEHRLLDRRAGGPRWHLSRALPARDAEGRLTRWIGTCTNIHEQRRALEALAGSEETLRQITENIREVFWMSDREIQAILYISPAYEQIWGRTCRSLIEDPTSWAASIHPQDRERAFAHTLEMQARGESFVHQYRIVRPDGAVRWIQDRGFPVRDEHGQVVRFVGTATDVTELERAQQALRLLQTLSLAVAQAESLNEALEVVLSEVCVSAGWTIGQAWLPDREGEVIACAVATSDTGAGLAGFGARSRELRYAPGQGIPGRVWASGRAEWIPDVQRDPGFRRGPEAAAAGLRLGVCVPVLAGQKVIAVLEFFARERREEDPRLLQLVSSVGAQLGQALQRRLVEEALRSTEEQLRQSQKMEAVGRLAGGVAHDFNNLLTVISGYAELMSTRLGEQDPLRRELSQIRGAAQRAAGLTRQLLVFSRNEAIVPRVLDVNAILADMEPMLRRLIGEDVELVLRLDPALGRIKLDKGYLEQVVLNLCVNARDAMPRGGRLEIASGDGPGALTTISVSDTGVGMSPHTVSHLFEPFFTTKEPGKGTGLGLSTVYGIVQGGKGRVEVETEPGRGTTFRVLFPRVDEAPSVELPPEAAPPGRGQETVLLVEDDEMVRELAEEILRWHGYQVIAAANGGEALLHCERSAEPIQLLLTDVVMPRMSGPELARRLRALRPGLKVLFTSGYTSGALEQSGELVSGAQLLQKPFTPQSLGQRVREVLDGR